MKLYPQDRQLALETSFPRVHGLPEWSQSHDCCNILEEPVSRPARMWTIGLRGKGKQLRPHVADIAAPPAFSGYSGVHLGMKIRCKKVNLPVNGQTPRKLRQLFRS